MGKLFSKTPASISTNEKKDESQYEGFPTFNKDLKLKEPSYKQESLHAKDECNFYSFCKYKEIFEVLFQTLTSINFFIYSLTGLKISEPDAPN